MKLIDKTVNYDENGKPDGIPTYLYDQAEAYQRDPRDAGLEWFASAKLGLSLHYGLSTLLGVPEDPAEHENFNLEQYRLLPQKFSCAHFDAMDIAELAIASGARYISMPAKLKDGFCLFNAPDTEYSSVKSPAQRDLVGEMASVCEYHGLGLCLTYPFTKNWMNNTVIDKPASPTSDTPDEEPFEIIKEKGAPENLEEFKTPFQKTAEKQIRYLLSEYGPIAALKIDGFEDALKKPILKRTFSTITKLAAILQPQILVSFQQGLTGDENFYTVDQAIPSPKTSKNIQGLIHDDASKPLELRFPMSPSSFSYSALLAGKHLTAAAAWALLEKTRLQQSNLLLHTCLMPDGSLDLEDINTLLELGKHIETTGFPD
ncbi:MAG: alpha-L-fucosidase [Lentisphaeria bacterium]